MRLSHAYERSEQDLYLPCLLHHDRGPTISQHHLRATGTNRQWIAAHVELEIQGRSSVFSAVVEPGRDVALIGAIVLEELDFVPDRTRQVLLPRDQHGLFAEIE